MRKKKPEHLESYRIEKGCHDCAHVFIDCDWNIPDKYYCQFKERTLSNEVENNGICDTWEVAY